MNVSDAVAARRSIRSFLDTPVSDDVIRELLAKSARAPSGRGAETSRRKMPTLCEECGAKQAGFGTAEEGTKRWCKSCGEAHNAVLLTIIAYIPKKVVFGLVDTVIG